MKGYVVISVALILLFVTIGIASTVFFLSTGSAKNSLSLSAGDQELYFSDSCLEEALLRLRNDPSYGGGNMAINDGECQISVDNQDGIYNLSASYFAGHDYRRGVTAEAEIVDGAVSVRNWAEDPSVIE